MNYKKLGLKAGLELHQQLDTKHKLFCNCSTEMKEKEPIKTIKRKQHPVPSELGKTDVAAQYEYLRDRTFLYQVFPKENCIIELDEAPPLPLNQESLEIVLQISLLLNCEIPNEIHVMRKTVIDGSNPTGFQRTAVVGLNGFLKYKGKKVPITQVSLEEDAAAIVKEENGNITYRLNRLAVPLVEISTGLLKYSPQEIQEIAYLVGMICRSTNNVKHGIGSIRQDINVSIKKGERTEIKGVQELGLLSKIVENEVQRQLSMIEIKNELKKRKVRKIISKPVNVNKILEHTKTRIFDYILEKGGIIFAIKLPKFSGLLKKEICPGRTLGRELADYVSSFGVKGIIHSDEDLKKYQLVEEFKSLKSFLKAKKEDAVVLVGEIKDKGKVSNLLVEKCSQILKGLKEETRAANPDGTTRYTRPLPGAARLYPETDIEPVSVKEKLIKKLKKELPEPLTKKLIKFKKKLKLSSQLANQILRSKYLDLFEEIVETKKAVPSVVANTFISTLKDLKKREKVKVENLIDKHFVDLFDYLSKKKIVKEVIPEILKFLAKNPKKSVGNAVKSLKLKPIKLKELKKIVKKVLDQPRMSLDKAIKVIMGKVRGRADAKTVIKTVKKTFKK
jgi:glutamyl-tRNA(Gln) amidotransferase subunit E